MQMIFLKDVEFKRLASICLYYMPLQCLGNMIFIHTWALPIKMDKVIHMKRT